MYCFTHDVTKINTATRSQSVLYAVLQLTVPFGKWATDPVQVSVRQ